jgi:hypothetical protein
LKFRKGRSALKPESKKIVLVLLAALFLWIRSRLKYFLFAGLLVILVFLGNGQTQYTYFLSVKDSARYFEQVIAAIE